MKTGSSMLHTRFNRVVYSLIFVGLLATISFGADPVPPFTASDSIKVTPVSLPMYTNVLLPNGLKIYLVPQSKLPTIAFRLIVKSGAADDPTGQAGITDFTAGLLRKGASYHGKEIGSNAISGMIDSVGGYLGAGADLSFVYAFSWGLSKHSDLLLDLLATIVQSPTFPESEVMRAKYMSLSQIMAKKDNPDEMARELFRKELYGTHPLGIPTDGDSTSVASFSREMAVTQWSRIAIPNNAVMAIVGDFDKDAMVKKVTAAFGNWKKGELLKPVEDAKVELHGIQVRLKNQEDAVQSTIRIGHEGIARNNRDYYAALVMQSILMGGDFDSRLTKVIRTEKGLTYGIGGGFRVGKIAGPVSIGTSTKTASTGEMIKSIFDVIEDFRRNGPTDDELKQAIMYLTGSYPLNFETPDDIASEILNLDLYGLSPKTIPEYRLQIARITKNEVKRVTGELLHPENILIVIVGKNAETMNQVMGIGRPNLNIVQVNH